MTSFLSNFSNVIKPNHKTVIVNKNIVKNNLEKHLNLKVISLEDICKTHNENVIDNIDKFFVLLKLIEQSGITKSVQAKYDIAMMLFKIIDELAYSDINLTAFKREYLSYYQEHINKRLDLLNIITTNWRFVLNEQGFVDGETARRNAIKLFAESIMDDSNIAVFSTIQSKEHADLYNKILDLGGDVYRQEPINLYDVEIDHLTEARIYEAGNIFDEESFINGIINNASKPAYVVCQDDKLKRIILSEANTANDINLNYYIKHYDLNIKDNDFGLLKNKLESEFGLRYVNNFEFAEISDLKYLTGSTIIMTAHNDTSWATDQTYNFFLDERLRDIVGLSSPYKSAAIEDGFAHAFINNNDVFITRSKTIGADKTTRSALLSKLLFRLKQSKTEPKFITKYEPTVVPPSIKISPNPEISKCPNEITSKQLELLSNDPYSFYSNAILGVHPNINDEKKFKTNKLLKDITNSFIATGDRPEQLLSEILDSDPMAFQRAINILKHLELKRFKLAEKTMCSFSTFSTYNDIVLVSNVDRLDFFENSTCLISYKHNITAKSIIDGPNIKPLIDSWIINKSTNFQIDELQIWNLKGYSHEQIDVTSVAITKELLNEVELKIKTLLEEYSLNQNSFELSHHPNDYYHYIKRNELQ